MAWLKRAKRPELPEGAVTSTGGFPPVGAGADLAWFWSAISAGMVTGAVPGQPLPVGINEVLAIPAVAGSLALLTSYASQMPLVAVSDATTPPTTIEPTPPILRCPVGEPTMTNVTLADWVDSLIHDLALFGNYLAVLGDLAWDGWPRIMYPVPVGYWEVFYQDGARIYRVGDDEYAPTDIFHVAINRRSGELVGRGLLSNNPDAVQAAVMAERWTTNYFQTGATPSVHLSHPNPDLTQAQADDLKAKFLDAVAGGRAPVITPIGTTIDVLPNDAERAQLVEARKWSNAALAIALGIQPAMLGLEGPSMTYRNLVEVNQQVISTTMMRYLIPVEQQLTAQCLPRGTRAMFQVSALVRPDYAERMTQAIAGLQGGVLTTAEARGLLDLPPEPSLDESASGDLAGTTSLIPTQVAGASGAAPTTMPGSAGATPLSVVGGGQP